MEDHQICFEADGYVFCNAIYRNGELVFTDSGKWWKFPSKSKQSAESTLSDQEEKESS